MTEPTSEQVFWEWVSQFPSFMGVSFARLTVLSLGVMLLIWVGIAFWERRMRSFPSVMFTIIGLTFIVLSLNTGLILLVTESSFLLRIRFLMGLLSVCVLSITFESIRISRLRERFALLWLGTGLMVLLAALFPQSIEFLTRVLGVQYVTAVVAVVFTFLLLVSFHYSIALSSLEADRAKIAQRCALLELRLKDVEAHIGLTKPEPDLPRVPFDNSKSEKPDIRGAYAGSLYSIIFSVLAILLALLKRGGFTPASFSALVFWVQLLASAFAWANLRRGKNAWSPFLFVLLLSSLPGLLLGVLQLHPGLAMAAQVMTAFYLLQRGNFFPAAIAMSLGMAMSIQTWIFFPALLMVSCNRLLREQAYDGEKTGEFRPYSLLRLSGIILLPLAIELVGIPRPESNYEHPGYSFISLLGVLGFLVVIFGLTGLLRPRSSAVPTNTSRNQPWPIAVGVFFVGVALLLRGDQNMINATLPAIPFLALPLCEWSLRIIQKKFMLAFAVLLAVFQIVYALQLGVN